MASDRWFNGVKFFPYRSFSQKAKAKKQADELRKDDHMARVVSARGAGGSRVWVVYADWKGRFG